MPDVSHIFLEGIYIICSIEEKLFKKKNLGINDPFLCWARESSIVGRKIGRICIMHYLRIVSTPRVSLRGYMLKMAIS